MAYESNWIAKSIHVLELNQTELKIISFEIRQYSTDRKQ